LSENSKIEWTDHTFNAWRGCEHDSEGCLNCYAELGAKRNPKVLGTWGPNGVRGMASEAYWGKPLAWNNRCVFDRVRRRVFCNSIADVWEQRPELVAPRARLLGLAAATPNLDWLMLTKRAQAAAEYFVDRKTMWAAAAAYRDLLYGPGSPVGLGDGLRAWPPENVWVGASVENKAAAQKRLDHLCQIHSTIRFVSCEPLLEEVDLRPWLPSSDGFVSTKSGPIHVDDGGRAIDWVIVGGESGPKARPCNIAWIQSIVDQCREAGVPCFVKQLGHNVEACDIIDAADYFPGNVRLERGALPHNARVILSSPKGGDPAEWPLELVVRQMPTGKAVQR
jgi:protein gp37